MDSKEFGLVAAQQLFQADDLHYGFWEKGEVPTIEQIKNAQKKYTAFLTKQIDAILPPGGSPKILDAGCGTGVTLETLLAGGRRADGLVPSNWMAQQARKRAEKYADGARGNIYECAFEGFPIVEIKEKYNLVLFSESFQYVDMPSSFAMLNLLLAEGGSVVIFDFFRRDGVPGKSPIGGGHSLAEFYETLKKNGFKIQTDEDMTDNMAPNIRLINDLLVQRIIPFAQTADSFLSARYPLTFKFIKFIFRKKLANLKFKYSQNRNEESFKKYKTYRLVVLKRA